MLYFAYGSNLNHHQMKKDRCIGSKYLKSFRLKDYKLIFAHPNKSNKFGYANIVKKKVLKLLVLYGILQESTKLYLMVTNNFQMFIKKNI